MKVAARTLLLGASTAALAAQDQQQVLGGVSDAFGPVVDSFKQPLESFEKALGKMPSQAKGLWDEMSLLVPGFMEKASNFISHPKSHTKKPDSEWDRIIKGEEIQNMWIETDGVKHRKLDGHLKDYSMRVKKVDPSKLGVDKVKQYSGYLDDEANDKHLFYCEYLYMDRRCQSSAMG